jgi:hypothetical protein
VVTLIALGTPPGAGDTGEQVVAWFREHRDGACCSVWAVAVSTLPFAVMFAILRRLLPPPYRDVFFFGAIVAVMSYVVQSWIWAGLALHADRLAPATARTVLDVALFFGPVLTGATTTTTGPVTLLALRGTMTSGEWWTSQIEGRIPLVTFRIDSRSSCAKSEA